MNTILIQLAIAAGVFAAGGWAGMEWHAGQDAIKAQAAAKARDQDAAQQRQANDKAAFRHSDRLVTINNQLGEAREKIAQLSGRECLSADTVRVLNAIGGNPVRAPAINAASAPQAPAAGADLRFATDRDTANAIAVCRAAYAQVSDQVNQILDIEDRRHSAQ